MGAAFPCLGPPWGPRRRPAEEERLPGPGRPVLGRRGFRRGGGPGLLHAGPEEQGASRSPPRASALAERVGRRAGEVSENHGQRRREAKSRLLPDPGPLLLGGAGAQRRARVVLGSPEGDLTPQVQRVMFPDVPGGGGAAPTSHPCSAGAPIWRFLPPFGFGKICCSCSCAWPQHRSVVLNLMGVL